MISKVVIIRMLLKSFQNHLHHNLFNNNTFFSSQPLIVFKKANLTLLETHLIYQDFLNNFHDKNKLKKNHLKISIEQHHKNVKKTIFHLSH